MSNIVSILVLMKNQGTPPPSQGHFFGPYGGFLDAYGGLTSGPLGKVPVLQMAVPVCPSCVFVMC